MRQPCSIQTMDARAVFRIRHSIRPSVPSHAGVS